MQLQMNLDIILRKYQFPVMVNKGSDGNVPNVASNAFERTLIIVVLHAQDSLLCV